VPLASSARHVTLAPGGRPNPASLTWMPLLPRTLPIVTSHFETLAASVELHGETRGLRLPPHPERWNPR
jgi:hypothetical protein